MTYLIMQMLLCLLIAAAIGAILGWLLRSWLGGDTSNSKALIAELQTKLGLAEKSTADFKAKFADVNGKLGLLETDATKLRGELSDWKLKFETADRDAQAQRSQFLNLQGTMQSAKADWDTKIAALSADHKQSLGMMETQTLGRISVTETQWRERLARAEAATLDVRRQYEAAEAEIARLKGMTGAGAKSDEAMVLRFNATEADWKSKLAASERQIGALSEDLGRYRARISSLESDLGACGSARASLQEELDRLRSDMSARPAASSAPLGFAAAAAGAMAAVAPVTSSAPQEVDDLKDVVGIGPVLERQLNAAGVRTFRDLARLTPQGVLALAEKLEHVFGDRITRERWVEQAADLHRKKYGTEP